MNRWEREVKLAMGKTGRIVRTSELRALGLTRDERRQSTKGLNRVRRGSYMLEPNCEPVDHHLALLSAV